MIDTKSQILPPKISKTKIGPRKIISELPDELYVKIEGKGIKNEQNLGIIGENPAPVNPDYKGGIHPSINIPFSRDNQPTILPLRLVNIKGGEEKVENIIPSPSSFETYKNYAILSHSWGEKELGGDVTPANGDDKWSRIYSNYLKDVFARDGREHKYPKSYKSLFKAVKALNAINKEIKKDDEKINYLWMDQLCMDQRNSDDNIEMSYEMLKMRRYYANSALTLIAIRTKLEDALNKFGKKKGEITEIINRLKGIKAPEHNSTVFNDAFDILSVIMCSEWRFSSWTYQEGWLSKNTIFMFDDILIDGRFLATAWASHVITKKRVPTSRFEGFEKFREKWADKYATPIGWVIESSGRDERESVVSINLNQALIALMGRRVHDPIDSIRCILGLLPYGNLMEVQKLKEWKIEGRKIKEGDWSKKNELFQKALGEVMKVAALNGYGEILGWFGSEGNPNGQVNSWLPVIKEKKNKNGRDIFSTNVVEKIFDVYCTPGSSSSTAIEFTEKLTGSVGEKSVRLKNFKEYSISKIGDFVPYTPADGKPSNYFYRLDENNKVKKDFLSKRKVTVQQGQVAEIIIEGTIATLGQSQRWNETTRAYENISTPTQGIKNIYTRTNSSRGGLSDSQGNELKFLVPNNQYWKSVKIEEGKEQKDSVPFAILVEKNGQEYKRIDLVKLLVSSSTSTTSNQEGEQIAQIEVWSGK